MSVGRIGIPQSSSIGAAAAERAAVYPQAFGPGSPSVGADVYLRCPLIRTLVEFFERKGLAALKEEDQREQWYEDWIAYQTTHQLYARLLPPREYSTLGSAFDLLRFARFLEVIAYFSPAHGYSLQVTFLGLFAILMGDNAALKREAVAALEAGGLLAFGVSEQSHGSDLLGNAFAITESGPGRFLANGTKYYIGNSNSAAIITLLARKDVGRGADRARRAPFVLFALRPAQSKGFRSVRKIRTLGVRAAFVGAFEVTDHPVNESDLAAEGRNAWDAVFGTVTLGKFFLGFGSIGICEHALEESVDHLRRRILYGRPAIEMPHLRATMAQAYARLTAMKLYAYRALDYVHAGSASDRRYLLFAAVQKAKVSAEGVKVMALLSECVGARGFEADTYFETALRDVQLIPGLEGSTHINLGLTAQFIPPYFARADSNVSDPPSIVGGAACPRENPYLLAARSGAPNSVAFGHFLESYRPLMSVPNVRLFAKQAKRFQLLARRIRPRHGARADTPFTLATGQCLATIAYAQLVAENSTILGLPAELVSTMFHNLVNDFNIAALALAAAAGMDEVDSTILRRVLAIPRSASADWDFVAAKLAGPRSRNEGGPG